MRRLRYLLILAILLPSSLGSAAIAVPTDAEYWNDYDRTTLLGQIARGTYRWRSE